MKKKRIIRREPDLIAGRDSVLGIYRSVVDSLVGVSCANILDFQFLNFSSAYWAAVSLSKVYPHLPIAVIIYPDHISCRIKVALPYDARKYLEKCFDSGGNNALGDEFAVFVELPNTFSASAYGSVEEMTSDLVSFCPPAINGDLSAYKSLEGLIDPDKLDDCFDDAYYGYEYNLVSLDLEFYGFGCFIPREVYFWHKNEDFETRVDVKVFVFPPRSWSGFLEFLSSVSGTSHAKSKISRISKVLSSLYPFAEDDYFLSFVDHCEKFQRLTVANMSDSLDFAYRFATEPTGTILDKFDRLLVVLPDGRIEGFHGAFISVSPDPDLHLDKDIGRELDRSYCFLVPSCFFDGRDYKYGFHPFMKKFYKRGYLDEYERDTYQRFLVDMPSIIHRMNNDSSDDEDYSWIESIYGLDSSLRFDGILSRWFLNCYVLNPKESDIIRALATWKRSLNHDNNVSVEFWTLPLPAFEDQGWRKHLDYYKLRIAGQPSLF